MEMAEGISTIAIADEVFGIAEVGAQILGFLPVADLRRVALVSKRFHRAAQFHLWRSVRVPYLYTSPDQTSDVAFWDRYSSLLERHTLSLFLDMSVVDPVNFQRIMSRQWQAPFTAPECFLVKVDLDTMFHGLVQTLIRAKRLRSFAAQDVPRILDILRLLNLHHGDIQSISIAASSRDSFGLRPVPAIHVPHWNYEVFPNLIVPLANSVSLLGPDLGILVSPFPTFPKLRSLSLTNLQHDCFPSSSLLEPLVWILRSAPDLAHLELSMRHKLGGISLSGYFLENMYGAPNAQDHALRSLCLRYKQVGGRPLRLKTLRLGYGCEIAQDIGNPFQPHYLSDLTDFTCLTELHVESPNHKDGTYLPPLPGDHGFGLATSGFGWFGPGMPNLRKLTWPWEAGTLMGWLFSSKPTRLSGIVLRIDTPTQVDWAVHTYNDKYPTWAKRDQLSNKSYTSLRLKGLILPAEHMCPEDADNFLCFVSHMKPMHSLKIRMPSLTGGHNSRGRMRTFRARMERMTELRELWLADGLGRWSLLDAGRVNDPYPTEAQFQRFASTLAEKCPKLAYLRILDRAWTITRPDEEGADTVLKPLMPWQVEHELPEAFDWSRPKVL